MNIESNMRYLPLLNLQHPNRDVGRKCNIWQVLPVIGSLFETGANYAMNESTNDTNERIARLNNIYNEQLAEKQNLWAQQASYLDHLRNKNMVKQAQQFEAEQAQLARNYNSAAAEVARMRQAGLNPTMQNIGNQSSAMASSPGVPASQSQIGRVIAHQPYQVQPFNFDFASDFERMSNAIQQLSKSKVNDATANQMTQTLDKMLEGMDIDITTKKTLQSFMAENQEIFKRKSDAEITELLAKAKDYTARLEQAQEQFKLKLDSDNANFDKSFALALKKISSDEKIASQANAVKMQLGKMAHQLGTSQFNLEKKKYFDMKDSLLQKYEDEHQRSALDNYFKSIENIYADDTIELNNDVKRGLIDVYNQQTTFGWDDLIKLANALK